MTFRNFIANLNQQIGIQLPDDWETIRNYLKTSNRTYLRYQIRPQASLSNAR